MLFIGIKVSSQYVQYGEGEGGNCFGLIGQQKGGWSVGGEAAVVSMVVHVVGTR